MQHYYRWDIQWLETMMPWERYNYLHMLEGVLLEEQRRDMERQSGERSSSRKVAQPPARK